jgi:hypothetical protein
VPPPVAVKVILVVEQSNIVVEELIAATGVEGSAVIIVDAVAVHPFAAVTITEYVPAVEIVFVGLVVPSFHK